MSLITTAARTLQKLLYGKGPYRIWLLRSSAIDADGNSDPFEGFAKANRLSFDIDVRRDHGEGDITVSIEHSDDGETWTELVAAETTTGNQTVTLTAELPWNDQIRVVWDVTDSAVWRVWVRATAAASFAIADVPTDGGSQTVKRTWVPLTADDIGAAGRIPFFDFGESTTDGFALALVLPSTVTDVALQEVAGPGWDDDLSGDSLLFGYPPGATVQDLLDHIVATPEAAAKVSVATTVGDTSATLTDVSAALTFASVPSGLTLAEDEVLFGVLADITEAFDQSTAIAEIGDGVDGGDSVTYSLDLTSATDGAIIRPLQPFSALDTAIRAATDAEPVLIMSANAAPSTGSVDLCYLTIAAAS